MTSEQFTNLLIVLLIVSGCVAGSEHRDNSSAPADGLLRVSSNGHYLEKPDGTPFFFLSDTEWLLNSHSDSQVIQILDDRKKKGFTVIQVFAGHDFDGFVHFDKSHLDANGNPPFDQWSPPKLNDAYWDRWRWIVDKAAERGLYLLLIYGEPGRAPITPQWAYEYGRLVGERFKDQKERIIFCNGQDTDMSLKPDVWRAMAEGVADGVNGQNSFDGKADYSTTLMTAHGYKISETFQKDDWIDFYGPEVWHNNAAVYQQINRDYNLANPTKPTVLLEGTYEAEGQGYPYHDKPPYFQPRYIRIEAWHTYFAGGMGYAYGHCENWKQCQSVDYLKSPGAQNMAVLQKFMASRKWFRFVPDQGMIASGEESGAKRVVAVSSTDHDEACVYFPMVEAARIRMDRITTKRSVTATWFDPRNGNTQRAGRYSRSDTATLTPPSDWEDAVLLLQSDDRAEN